ncbi:MAG TPA: hypothetical protein VLB44_00505 [Kofleriaceae bacterium]|nr:hypothetical protein [Kofleriaceae bacterium]
MSDKSGDDGDEPVPKLPRGRGLKFSGPEMLRIVMTLVALVGVIVLARPCANSVSNFVMGYSGSDSASKMPKPGVEPPAPAQSDLDQYEHLRPGMSDEEMKAAVERAKAKNAGAAQNTGSAGSAAPTPPPAGSASSAP